MNCFTVPAALMATTLVILIGSQPSRADDGRELALEIVVICLTLLLMTAWTWFTFRVAHFAIRVERDVYAVLGCTSIAIVGFLILRS